MNRALVERLAGDLKDHGTGDPALLPKGLPIPAQYLCRGHPRTRYGDLFPGNSFGHQHLFLKGGIGENSVRA